MKSEPPSYLKFIPFAFAAVIVAVLTAVYLFVAGFFADGVKKESGLAGIFSDAREVVEEFVEEFKRIDILGQEQGKKEAREKRLLARLTKMKQRATKPKAGPLAEEPVIIEEFSSKEKVPALMLKTSRGAKASWSVDTKEPVSARLSISNMGPEAVGDRFVTGIVEFPVPVKVGAMEALELNVKGRGVINIGITLYVSRGEGTAGWSLTGVVIGSEWATLDIPMVDFDHWLYNVEKSGYVYPPSWAKPEKVEAVGFFVKPQNLSDANTGALWIDSIALR